MHIVIVTFTEPTSHEIDQEFMGPFASIEEAHAWADQFEAWFAALDGERQIANILVTPLSRPVVGLMV